MSFLFSNARAPAPSLYPSPLLILFNPRNLILSLSLFLLFLLRQLFVPTNVVSLGIMEMSPIPHPCSCQGFAQSLFGSVSRLCREVPGFQYFWTSCGVGVTVFALYH